MKIICVGRNSAVFTIEPGDLTLTGTPPGAGCVVEVEVEGIGVLRNPVVRETGG